MASPSPFMIGQTIGKNFAQSQRKVQDQSAIESILSNAMQSEDPAVLQNSIGQILSQVSPERQGAAVEYLQNTYNQIQQRQAQERQRKAAVQEGLNPDLPPNLQAEQFKQAAKAKRIKESGVNEPATTAPPGPGMAPQPPQGVTPPKTGLQAMSDDQIVRLTGHPDREVSEPAKAEQKRREAEVKELNRDRREGRKEILDFHKESQKYDEDLLKQTKIAKNQIETIDNIEESIKSGKVKPSSLANIFKGLGDIGNKVSEALISKDEASLQASIPALLEGWKEIFGVRLTDADLKLLQDKLPSIGKTPVANNAIIKILKKYAEMNLLRGQIASDIKKNNKGLRPLGYADQIESRFDEMTKPVEMVSPKSGRTISVPAYRVGDAIKAGAKLANEQL